MPSETYTAETAGMTLEERADWVTGGLFTDSLRARAIAALSETLSLGTVVIPHLGIINSGDRSQK